MGFTIPNNDVALAANPQSLWFSTDIVALVQGVLGEGVVSGCAVTAQASPALSVAVASGTVVIAGIAVTVTGANVAVPAGGNTMSRLDIVTVSAAGTLTLTSGTAATNPAPPAIPAASVLLAMIYVPLLDTTIEANQITDKRVVVGVSGPGLSVDGEAVLWSGTSGNRIARSGLTGLIKQTAGVPSVATAGTDYLTPTTQKALQVVSTQSGAVATGTTVIPGDDTIPQITEGDQYLTLAVTPGAVTNKLRIDVRVYVASSAANRFLAAALFQDATAGALASGVQYAASAGGTFQIAFTHYMTAGTTSATTFRVRAGADGAGTTTFNGSAGGRLYGGVLASSITITEYTP